MSIPVAPEMEIVATAQAAALGEYLAMTRDKIDEVKLALVEACINAFEHAHTCLEFLPRHIRRHVAHKLFDRSKLPQSASRSSLHSAASVRLRRLPSTGFKNCPV